MSADEGDIERYAREFVVQWARALDAVGPWIEPEERERFKTWLATTAVGDIREGGPINDVTAYVREHASMWLTADAAPGVH